MIGLSRLLNLESNLTQPAYLSSLVFELRMDVNGSHFVQIKRKNSSYAEPLRLVPVQIDGWLLLIILLFILFRIRFYWILHHIHTVIIVIILYYLYSSHYISGEIGPANKNTI